MNQAFSPALPDSRDGASRMLPPRLFISRESAFAVHILARCLCSLWLLPYSYLPRRVYADGKVEYLHPKDGVYPEKVNAGRVGVNQNMRPIGANVDPIKVNFQGQGQWGCM